MVTALPPSFRPRPSLLLASCAVLALALPAAAQGQSFRVVSLDTLSGVPTAENGAPAEDMGLPVGSLLDLDDGESGSPFAGERNWTGISPDALLQVLEGRPELGLGAKVIATPRPGRIDLRGEQAAVDAAAAAIEELMDTLVQPIALEMRVYTWPGNDLPPAVVSAQEWSRWFGESKANLLGRHVARTRSGTRGSLGHVRRIPYVPDVDVEVAQEASIHDPQVRWLLSGLQMQVEAHRLNTPGRVALLGHLVAGELESGIPPRSSGDDDMPSMDAPEIHVANVSCSGVVADGGGLVVSVRKESGWLVVVLRAQLQGSSAALAKNNLIATSALATVSFDEQPTTLLLGSDVRNYGDEGIFFSGNRRNLALVHPRPAELLLGLLEGDSTEGYPLPLQAFSAVMSVQDSFANLAANAADLERDNLRTVTWQMTGADGIELVRSSGLTGRHAHAVLGKEWIEVCDYNVEIAQKASARNPVSRSAFSGVRMAALPSTRGNGLHLTTTLELHDADGTRRRHGGNKSADLFLVDRGYQKVQWHGSVEPDQAINLGGSGKQPLPTLTWSAPDSISR